GIYQVLQAVALGEAFDKAFAMFPGATCKICRDARVQRAVRPVGHNVHPGAFHHRGILRLHPTHRKVLRMTFPWMAGTSLDKPGHDVKWRSPGNIPWKCRTMPSNAAPQAAKKIELRILTFRSIFRPSIHKRRISD